jgi:ribosome-associated translation inhibitor RaiA
LGEKREKIEGEIVEKIGEKFKEKFKEKLGKLEKLFLDSFLFLSPILSQTEGLTG